MSEQLPLELVEGALDRAFARFHAENPAVYDALRRLALKARRMGRERIGIGMLWEALRWEMFIAASDSNQQEWKLNNSYRSRYARLLMQQEPELRGAFETRTLHREACTDAP